MGNRKTKLKDNNSVEEEFKNEKTPNLNKYPPINYRKI